MPSDEELESSADVSAVGMPEVVSIICTRPMVVGPLSEATLTLTSSTVVDEPDESLAADWLPHAASIPVMAAELIRARASRLVALRWFMWSTFLSRAEPEGATPSKSGVREYCYTLPAHPTSHDS